MLHRLISARVEKSTALIPSTAGCAGHRRSATGGEGVPNRLAFDRAASFHVAFRAGLRDLGYVEGQNVVIGERYAEGQPDRLPGLARELIAHRIDVFVTSGSLSALAAKEATTTVPIVSTRGVQLISLKARDAAGIDAAFTTAVREHVGGLIPVSSPVFAAQKRQMVALAAKHWLPTMHEHRDFVDSGGLMSYGPNLDDVHRRAAVYVDISKHVGRVKILKGTKPGDLPVELPTKFELVINLKRRRRSG